MPALVPVKISRIARKAVEMFVEAEEAALVDVHDVLDAIGAGEAPSVTGFAACAIGT